MTEALVIDLASNEARRLGCSVRLPPARAELLFAIQRKYPEAASRNELMTALYGATEDHDFSERAIDAYVTRLRANVGPLGVRILNVYGTGYRLAFEDRAIDRPRRARRASPTKRAA